MALLDDLKTKYQTVIQRIDVEGVHLDNLHLQDAKLFMKGTAPSLAAANKVWNEIKRINPKLDDITAEFRVDAYMKTSAVQTYTVKSGDTLSKISKEFYGNSTDYIRIFNANKDQLEDPGQITVGQKLKIPPAA
jgi:nucleoid-associated protein YgaU